MVEINAVDVVDAVELHLLNEWHLRNARERRRERMRRESMRRDVPVDSQAFLGHEYLPVTQPALPPNLALCYALVALALMALSAAILAVWG